MTTVSSALGTQATQPASAGFSQLRLQQARRNAEQAELAARALQAQASNAQRTAARAQENARSLSVQSDEAQTVAGRARQGLHALDSANAAFSRVGKVIERIAPAAETPAATPVQALAPATPAPASTAPAVLNTDGQVTGTLVNTSA